MFRALVLTMLVFAVVAAAQEHATDAVVQTQALGGDRSAVAIASDDVNHLVLYRDVRSGGTRLFVTRVSSMCA